MRWARDAETTVADLSRGQSRVFRRGATTVDLTICTKFIVRVPYMGVNQLHGEMPRIPMITMVTTIVGQVGDVVVDVVALTRRLGASGRLAFRMEHLPPHVGHLRIQAQTNRFVEVFTPSSVAH